MNSALSLRYVARVALCSLIASAALTTVTAAGAALVVHQAVAAVVNAGGSGPGCGIVCTYNQSGLGPGYVSDVTPWAPYTSVATHSTLSSTEWFSAPQAPLPASAILTYDLGVVTTVFGMALWNEDFGGIGQVDISFGDVNQVFGAPNAAMMIPTNNPLSSTPYLADVVAFMSPANTRYVRLRMSGCPQITPGVPFYDGCSLGEVAFAVQSVPEPSSLALAGLGCVGLVLLRRRDRALRSVSQAPSSSLATFRPCRSPTHVAIPAPAVLGPHTSRPSRRCGG